MGIRLSRGGLTKSQQDHCKKTGKNPDEYLKELLKLPINGGKPERKAKEEPKAKKFTWKKATAK